MKKALFLLVFISVLLSCSKDNELSSLLPASQSVEHSQGLNALQSKILELDLEYNNYNKRSILSGIRRVPNGPDWKEVVCADCSGILISKYWIVYAPTVESKLLVAASIGALFSAQYYVLATDGNQNFSNIHLSDISNFRRVDLRQPIRDNAPTTMYNNSIIGRNVGPLHNRGIVGLFKAGHLTPNSILSPQEMFDSIRSGIEIFNNVTYQNVGSLIAHGFDEYDDALFISSLSDQFSEELHIIDHVYEMQLNLDSTTLLGYTNQVMDIVNTAYVDHQISDSSAWLINASVSTLAHTRLLWKSYLPDYRLTTLYMAYIDDYSKWVLCNKSQLEYLSSHYHVTNVGIPSVIDGKCSEIFFFPSSTYFYGVNNTHFQHLFADDGFDIYESTSFERMVSNYTNHFFDNMTVGHRHVRSVPNENGITYVSFVEE